MGIIFNVLDEPRNPLDHIINFTASAAAVAVGAAIATPITFVALRALKIGYIESLTYTALPASFVVLGGVGAALGLATMIGIFLLISKS